jgi:serine/threonine-protein kinase HipA
MLQSVEVYINLKNEDNIFVGTLSENNLPGNLTQKRHSFTYSDEYLKSPESISISPDIPFKQGACESCSEKPLFGIFEDSGPDSWGKKLIQKDELHRASNENRSPLKLNDIETLARVVDSTRMGALRFSNNGGKSFLGEGSSLLLENIHLKDLMSAAHSINKDKEEFDDLRLVIQGGTSMGGANPKETAMDSDGRLKLIKFPKDEYDFTSILWEATALDLAKQAGFDVPDFRLESLGDERFALVIDRFDRDENGCRIPYMSAKTFLSVKDPYIQTSYQELGEALDLVEAKELFKRIVFTLLVNNTDDHFKNYGFLYIDNKWTFSPMFDINPTHYSNIESTPLLYHQLGTHRDINDLINSHESYSLSKSEAIDFAKDIEGNTRNWKSIAKKYFDNNDNAINNYKHSFENKNRELLRTGCFL